MHTERVCTRVNLRVFEINIVYGFIFIFPVNNMNKNCRSRVLAIIIILTGNIKVLLHAYFSYYLLLILFLCQLYLVHGGVINCEKDIQNSSKFEIASRNSHEWPFVGESHYIVCCATGYDTLGWYFNGTTRITYDESPNGTTFKLQPNNSDNRTIMSHSIGMTDRGSYTCIAKSNTDTKEKLIHVIPRVSSNALQSPMSGSSSTVTNGTVCGHIGANFSIPCEGVIGSEPFPNIMWKKEGLNKTGFLDVLFRGIIELEPKHCNGSNNGGRLACTLKITNITEEVFGAYTCTVSFPQSLDGARRTDYTVFIDKGTDCKTDYKWYEDVKVIISLVLVTILFVSVLVIFYKWKLEILLYWKQHFGKLEDNDNKTHDLFICYDRENADIILKKLVPILEGVYGYSCFADDRDSLGGTLIPETFSVNLRTCRRFVMVISRSFITNVWCIYSMYIAVKAVLESDSKIICIMLEDIPWQETEQGNNENYERLKRILKVIKKVYWEEGHNDNNLRAGSPKFWKSLLVNLPSKRCRKEIQQKQITYSLLQTEEIECEK